MTRIINIFIKKGCNLNSIFYRGIALEICCKSVTFPLHLVFECRNHMKFYIWAHLCRFRYIIKMAVCDEIGFSIHSSPQPQEPKNDRKRRSIRLRIGGLERVRNNGHSREIVLSPPSTFSPLCHHASGSGIVSIQTMIIEKGLDPHHRKQQSTSPTRTN